MVSSPLAQQSQSDALLTVTRNDYSNRTGSLSKYQWMQQSPMSTDVYCQ